jgi:hypothetical protein
MGGGESLSEYHCMVSIDEELPLSTAGDALREGKWEEERDITKRKTLAERKNSTFPLSSLLA